MNKGIVLAVLVFWLKIGFSQTITSTKLNEVPRFFYARVAWVEGNSVCVISEKDFTGSNFTHQFFFYDTIGNLIGEKLQFKRKYSVQHQYTLQLNKTFYFFETYSDIFGANDFKVKGIISGSAYNIDAEIPIFKIKSSEEDRKLNNERYKFEVKKGNKNKKALLTYNNDYKENYPEGFWFCTIDENRNVSAVDTFNLPYNDRECNISQVVYDDEKDIIYILGDLFELNGKERTFKKNFISIYNIATHSYKEYNDFSASMYKQKITAYLDDDYLAFTGIKIPEVKGKEKTGYSFVSFNLNTQEIENSCNGIIQDKDLEKFSKHYEPRFSQLLRPMKTCRDSSGNLHALFCHFQKLDDVSTFDDATKEFVTVLPLATGGIMLGMGVMYIPGESPSDDASSLIWLTLPLNNCSPLTTSIDVTLLTDNYNKHAFCGAMMNGSMYTIYNRSTESSHKFSQPYFAKFENNSITVDTTLIRRMKALKVNEIYPWSEYKSGRTSYYLGHFVAATDPYGDDPNEKEAFYLLRIEE